MLDIKTITQKNAIVKAMVTDLAGRLKEIVFPSSKLEELVKKGIAYDGSSFKGINHINSSDAVLIGDIESLVKCPEKIQDTEKEEYWIMCNIYDTNGKPHNNCARNKLIQLQKELAEKRDGGILHVGAEPEAFFVQNKDNVGTANGGNTNYFNPKDPKAHIIVEIANYLDEMGFEIERCHTEVGEDQFETNRKFDKAERTGDKIQIYKLLAHKVARLYGYDVTFLPKPYPTRNGSGMHCHLSVQNQEKNLFYDGEKAGQKYFSDKSLMFLQGILNSSRSIAAIANSTEVSYSRLVPGFEAPCIIAIGEHNRSASCRIPAIADQETIKKAIRTEFRFPDPLANPYLLACAFISVGIHGIESQTPFKGFTNKNLYELDIQQIKAEGFELLPRNLREAYKEYSSNEILKEKLGKSLFESFAGLILEEIDACQCYANTESIRRHYFA